jgi:hypothetical protein
MPRPTQLVKAAVTLVAALLAGNAIKRASKDRNFRRKANDFGESARKRVTSAGKSVGENLNRLAKAAGKQAPVLGREAAKRIKQLSKSATG